MNLEATVPELRALLKPTELPLESVDRVNAYLSPRGCGAPLHFDVRTVWIVQLVGTKLWMVSKRPATSNPHRNYVAPPGATTVDYDGEQLSVPDDLWVALLRPGDWLRIPKGSWHATFTATGSLSATLAASPELT